MIGAGWSEVFIGGSAQAEAARFATVAAEVRAIQDVVARTQAAPPRRAFHNKGDIVRVQFTVARDLPEPLQVGFLQPGAAYDGFGRFSRSQSLQAADGDFDERGFAFRLEIGAELSTIQDFLLSNTPRSFAHDPIQFLRAGLAFAQGSGALGVVVRLVGAVGLIQAARILLQLKREAPDLRCAFTAQSYWSRTPFRCGEAAVKFVLKPALGGVRATGDSPDFLSDQLRDDLARAAQQFTLFIQPFVDASRTPIEDAAVEWLERDSALIAIGTLTLPQQDLRGEAALRFAAATEPAVAFNPWHTVDLQPLGSMNRARRIAYVASAGHRVGRSA
jgi:Catalase